MSCPAKEKLARYLDGELGEREKRAVEAHLRGCSSCRSFLGKQKDRDRALRACRKTGRKRADCPDREMILAYADGNPLGGEERKRVAAHLAGCDRCALRAAEAKETVRLVERLQKEGGEAVPSYLQDRVRERLLPKEPFRLGRIMVELKKILKQRENGSAYPLPELLFQPAPDYVREPRPEGGDAYASRPSADFEEEAPRPKVEEAGRGKKRKPEPEARREFRTARLRAEVVMRSASPRNADLHIRLTDELKKPRAAVPLILLRGGKRLRTGKTGDGGSASFRKLPAGKYRLLIHHRPRVYLDLDIG